MRRLLTFFMLVLGQPVAWAQSWQELNAELEKHYLAGDYVKSLAAAEKALEQAKQEFGEADTAYARAYHQLAYVHHTVGNHLLAEKHYRQSLTAWKNLPEANWFEYGITLKCLGQLYGAMNRFPEAEPLLKEAVGRIRQGGGEKSADYADVLMTLGIVYRQMYRLDQAEPVQLEAVRVKKELVGENNGEYANFLNELALLYEWKAGLTQSQALRQKATALYEQVLLIRRNTLGRLHPRYANTVKGLAVIYAALQQNDRADSLFREAIAIYREKKLDQSTAYASIVSDYARLHLQMGNFTQTEKWVTEAVKIRRQKQSPLQREYIGNLGVLAEVYTSTGRYQQAEKLWVDVIAGHQAALRYNLPTLTESERNQYYAVARTYFEMFLSFATQPQTSTPTALAEAYNTRLGAKGVLLQSVYRMQRVATQLNDSSRALYEEWQTKKSSIAVFYNQSPEQQQKNRVPIKQLEVEAEELEKKLSYQSAPFARSLDKPVDWKQVQQRLKPGEAAVELVRFRKYVNSVLRTFTDTVHYAALIITREAKAPRLVLFQNGNDLEGVHLRTYQRNLQDQARDVHSYGQYWQPVARALGGVKRIYLSPDGVFNQLNLQVLLNPETGKYLVEETDLRLLTSTRDLLLPASGIQNRSIALFGFPDYNAAAPVATTGSPAERYYEKIGIERDEKFSPLPGTKTEVQNIGHITRSGGWKTQVFLAGQASEENLKNLSDPGVLHLATHGYFQSDVKSPESNPLLRAGLLLAGAKDTTRQAAATTEDGILTAYEATGLALEGTQLVVLSACETGLGEIRNGEGVYGLQRALSVAGAQSVLMSLWKVNDQVTQQLMTLFYRNWLRGLDSHGALRRAQAKIRRRAALAHPYYWGSFVLTGR